MTDTITEMKLERLPNDRFRYAGSQDVPAGGGGVVQFSAVLPDVWHVVNSNAQCAHIGTKRHNVDLVGTRVGPANDDRMPRYIRGRFDVLLDYPEQSERVDFSMVVRFATPAEVEAITPSPEELAAGTAKGDGKPPEEVSVKIHGGTPPAAGPRAPGQEQWERREDLGVLVGPDGIRPILGGEASELAQPDGGIGPFPKAQLDAIAEAHKHKLGLIPAGEVGAGEVGVLHDDDDDDDGPVVPE